VIELGGGVSNIQRASTRGATPSCATSSPTGSIPASAAVFGDSTGVRGAPGSAGAGQQVGRCGEAAPPARPPFLSRRGSARAGAIRRRKGSMRF
jgi:hypothetical protein